MTKIFFFNDWYISVKNYEGEKEEILVLSNLKQKDKKEGTLIQEFFSFKDNNNCCIRFENIEEVNLFKEVMNCLQETRVGKRFSYSSLLNNSLLVSEEIKENGCITFYSCNSILQKESTGDRYAKQNNFEIIKFKDIKLIL